MDGNAADSPYDRCVRLFDTYRLAVRKLNHTGRRRLMLLTVQTGPDDGEFYALIHDQTERSSHFEITPLFKGGGEKRASINVHTRSLPPGADRILRRAVPYPGDCMVFGWKGRDNSISTLLVMYADFGSDAPEQPHWTSMPRIGSDPQDWLPFAGQWLGRWFWEALRDGKIVDLTATLAVTSGVVYGTDLPEIGSWLCAVMRNIGDPHYTLVKGVYAPYGVLRSGLRLPSLEALRELQVFDMGPRIRDAMLWRVR